jgi:caa(3)-type oxidase subunit IV
METAHTHKRPNYILIWIYLAVLTAAELGLDFELPIGRNMKLALLLFLAVWIALLVGLYFMHLKFEKWNLRMLAIIPIPLALILLFAGMSEHIW